MDDAMPLPKIVGRMNRFGLNRVTALFSGRVPPFAMLIHRGRASGRQYRTPIFAFPTGHGIVIALTYGRGTDWERNVLHAGEAEVIYRGRRVEVIDPRLIEPEEASAFLPAAVRWLLPRFGVRDFIRLDRTD
jgi:deazaflavin-dependent oxidoreductase (nitroreductase family)